MRLDGILLAAWLACAGTALAQEPPPRFQKGLDLAEVLEFDASVRPPRPLDEPLTELDAVRTNLDHWLDSLVGDGASILVVEAFDRDGALYLDSPTLARAGFRPTGPTDLFGLLCERAARRELVLVVMLEDLAHIVRGSKTFAPSIRAQALTPDAVAAVVGEIAAAARPHGTEVWVNEEAYDLGFRRAIARAAARAGLRYVHFFDDPEGLADLCMSEDYTTHPLDLARDQRERALWSVAVEWGGGTLGMGTLVFGSQAARGRPAGVATAGAWGLVPGCQINIALLRAAQFAPSIYAFYSGWTEAWPELTREDEQFVRTFGWGNELRAWIATASRPPAETKPIANLVLCPPPERAREDAGWEECLMASVDMITNTLLAAGYELRVTYGEAAPPDAALVYAFAAPSAKVPAAIAARLAADRPCVVQFCGPLSSPAPWRATLGALGLPVDAESVGGADAADGSSRTPEWVDADFESGRARLHFRGYHFYEPDQPGNLGAAPWLECGLDLAGDLPDETEVILKSDDERPLLTRRGQRWFVNGSMVHMEFSIALANFLAMAPAPFAAPAFAYVSRGPLRTTVFAAADTGIRLRLMGGSRVRQWNERGRPVEPATVRVDGGLLIGTLARWNLAIVSQD